MTTLFNSSQEIVFVLHGLNVTQTNRHIYFVFFLILYLVTICINLTLIFTIVLEKMFHDPMYLFLCNLCINGIIGIFFIYFYVHCEFTHLTVMAYDRYVAICKPLHYHCIMTVRKVWTLILLSWLLSWLDCSIGMVLLARLPLCSVDIDRLYCSNWAVVKLSCVDTTIDNIHSYFYIFYHFFQAIFILISYVNIVKASLRSVVQRRKFMQTCLPHLITLINLTISLLFDVMYARYGSKTSLLALRNIMSVEFLVVPPLVNPIIYGMNLREIRYKVVQMLNCKVVPQ
uniref:G-protein coupled receptors family 1 profile domain-containing protein n=1 Tax=Esox lucius TaxID=8010 RepID=A0AAY5KUC7_ESOLU